MGHRPLSDFNQHCKKCLLQTVAQVLLAILRRHGRFCLGDSFLAHLRLLLLSESLFATFDQVLQVGEDPTERDIHTFNDIGKLNIVAAFLSHLLDVVSRRRIIAEPNNASKSVQTISNGDIERLSKDSIPFFRVSDDLCVTA